jgi:TRAP transporter TAXI family solute receptor
MGTLQAARGRRRVPGISEDVTISRRRLMLLAGAAGLLGPSASVFGQTQAPAAAAGQARFFRIGTGALGGVYYPVGGAIALAISNPPGSRPCDKGGSCGVPGLVAVAQSSHGSLSNVQAIGAGTLDSGFVQADVAYWAFTGTGIFEGKPRMDQLRAIANLYPEHVHLVVRKSAGVKGIRDLRNRTVSLDEQGSGTLVSARAILHAFGVRETDLKARYITASQSIKAVKEGALDAFFFFSGYPAPAVAELAEAGEIDLLPVSGPPIERLLQRFGFFAMDLIPSGAYYGVKRTDTISVGAQWLVSAKAPDDLVHDITAALWSKATRPVLEKSHPRAQQIKLETALTGLAVPLHPGAERFYRANGVLRD